MRRVSQYSVTSKFRRAFIDNVRQNVLPGAFWIYDISPFMVVATTNRTPLFEFLTGLCAIVGGVFTVRAAVVLVVADGALSWVLLLLVCSCR